jgi:3-hydroxyisobutyrate dehydrogenase-like beta-hydroxyacid dehydrogenase
VTVLRSAPLSVAVVGSGKVGTALATNLRSLGHDVRVARRSRGHDCDVGLDGAAVGAATPILAVPFGAHAVASHAASLHVAACPRTLTRRALHVLRDRCSGRSSRR